MSGDQNGDDRSRLRDHVHGGTFVHSDGPQPNADNVVVLIHGVGLDHTLWQAQVAYLKDQFHIVRYDMIGHGKSAHPPGTRELGDFVRQLHQLLMNLGLSRAAVIGFSMGGLVARAFAAAHPEMTKKLVLMNTVFRRSETEQKAVDARYALAKSGGLQEGIEAAVRRWFSPKFIAAHPDVIQTIEERLRNNDAVGYLNAYRVFATNRDPAESPLPIGCPTLVMTGELDSGSTPAMTQQLAAAIPGAHAEVLSGLRHMALQEDPARVNIVLNQFLEDGTAD